MNIKNLYSVIFILFTSFIWSQEDGVVSYALPARNSLTFNRFALSPTFTFVREQDRTISFTNKREWVQFQNAPVAYTFGYTGRLNENMGAGISLFQRNYGVLSTFGGVLNYAYNVPLSYSNNLTFAANLAVYQSGINTGEVVSTLPDPSLDNVPSNLLMTFNPSINYGIKFFDFGLTLRNYTLYNFTSSNLIEDDPEKSVQAHAMYTGFMSSSGFFDESKFSALVRSEFKKDDVVLSGLVMLTVPKGIWGQVGYNSVNGVSVGVGANLVKGIAIEYNYENGATNNINFGSSHEITLAYRFKPKEKYRYSDDMEMAAIVPQKKKKTVNKTDDATRARIAERAEARRQQKLQAETAAAVAAANNSSLQQEQQNKASISRQAEIEQARAIAEEEALAKLRAKQQAEEEAKRLAHLKANEEQRRQEALAVLAAAEAEEKRLQEAQEEEARRLAENEAKHRAELQAQQEAERLAQLKAQEEQRRQEALEALAAAEAEEQRIKDQQAKEAARLAAEQAAIEQAEKEAAAAEALRKKELQAQEEARLAAEKAAKEKADREAAEAKRLAMLKAEEDKRRAEALAILAAAEAEEQQNVTPPADEFAQSIEETTDKSNALKSEQEALLADLQATVNERKQDLADLKEENDLSEQGIYNAPKPFKSISEENAKLEALSDNLDAAIAQQDKRLKELQNLYKKRKRKVSSDEDEMNMIYLDEIMIIQESQKKTKEAKEALMLELEGIKLATEIERKRRIKRAAFDNQEDRYAKDMKTLEAIKSSTDVDLSAAANLNFDYGESNGGTIRILKDVKNTKEGYYLVMAVHSDKNKRDEFLRSAIMSGIENINFFYDVNTSKYYIYSETYKSISDANAAMAKNSNSGYDDSISMIRIENKTMK